VTTLEVKVIVPTMKVKVIIITIIIKLTIMTVVTIVNENNGSNYGHTESDHHPQ